MSGQPGPLLKARSLTPRAIRSYWLDLSKSVTWLNFCFKRSLWHLEMNEFEKDKRESGWEVGGIA